MATLICKMAQAGRQAGIRVPALTEHRWTGSPKQPMWGQKGNAQLLGLHE